MGTILFVRGFIRTAGRKVRGREEVAAKKRPVHKFPLALHLHQPVPRNKDWDKYGHRCRKLARILACKQLIHRERENLTQAAENFAPLLGTDKDERGS